ncbi:MAG: hypothetical protein MUC31_01205 [Bacteroidales bacterium]|jgi:hypothetical protein|nr:hypothetical protein [Bacteroidales bacterium]
MIIAFAFGLIGAMLVLANIKYLRILRVYIAAFILILSVMVPYLILAILL